MNRLLLLTLVAVSLSGGTLARAAERLVTNSTELNRALRDAAPGDVIILRDGEWRDLDLKVDFDATEGKPLTIRAQTPGKVMLTGASRARIGGSWIILDGLLFKEGVQAFQHVIAFRISDDRPARHSRVTNCAVINYRPAPEREGSTMYLSLYGQHNRVDHCYLRGKIDEGPMVVVWVEDEPNHHQIDHNHFAGRSPLGRNGGETLRVGTSQVSMNNSRTVVEHNLFTDCNGEAEYISNKSCENVYRYNTFVNNQGALVLRHGNRCTVEGNWFFGNGIEGTGGVRIIGEDHRIFNNYFENLAGEGFESAMPIVNGIPDSKLNEYFRVQRAIVAFNTFINCRQSITFGVGAGARNRIEPPMDCVFANNLVISESGPLVRFLDQPINTTWIGNYMGGAQTGIETEGVRTVDDLSARSVPEAAEGNFEFVADDIEGKTRGPRKDVGCFESTSSAASVRRPLSSGDVGPDWPISELPLPTTRPQFR